MEDRSLLNMGDENPNKIPKKQRIWLCGVLLGILLLGIIIIVAIVTANNRKKHSDNTSHFCYQTSQTLIELAGKTDPWEKLAEMADTFGPRLSGTKNLEDAIDWVKMKMIEDGLENVRTEEVKVPTWVRGTEYAEMISPRPKKIAMLGLGSSISTPPEGITAEVLVVTSFDDLQKKCASAAGKIVLYNPEWKGYSDTVIYRSTGASQAAKCNAVASLVKSMGPYSLYTPHTGNMNYAADVKKIPSAAITLEDTLMISRMINRGQNVTIHLYMEGHFLEDSISRNVMGEIVGKNPDQIVVIGGHIDSWDVGQGAMDDGGGLVVSWDAVRIMLQLFKKTNVRPRRTIRVVGWTNEENGARGAHAYRNLHLNETHVLAIESDGGVTKPYGLGFTGHPKAVEMLNSIAKLLEPVGANQILPGGGGVDIDPLMKDGVPGASLEVNREKYFWIHHTEGDTMDKLDPQEMRDCVATMAVMSYCVADDEVTLPRVEKN